MVFGVQLFGILNARRTEAPDVMETLRELRGLGFRQIEICLSDAPIPGFEQVIWPVDWFEAHAWEIRGLGLEVVSAHIFSDTPAAAAPRFARLARDHGIRQFVVKTPQEVDDGHLQCAAINYMNLADALEEAGAELLLHNEVVDIAIRTQGRTVYEHLLALCQGKVGAQVDVGWAWAGGEDPEALLWRLGSRVKSLHHKDLRGTATKHTAATLGAGDIDIAACFQFARAMGIPQIIDQDEFGPDPMAELAEGLKALEGLGQHRANTASYLNTLDTLTGEVKVLARFEDIIEAPNWLKGTNCIVFNSGGHLFRYDLDAREVTMIDTGACDNCNNDHVIAWDETRVAVSHGPRENPFDSRVYVLPIEGGTPRLVTPNAPSFLHGWSPDGEEFAYCAFREHGGKLEVDIYTIPAAGGDEVRLTRGGFNDGPEYAPDGRHIWFNSTRTGRMQIWRMDRDGGNQTQMTFNDRNNWFAHVSPDGKQVAYLSYRAGDLEPGEHLPNMQVELWLMDADGSHPRRVCSLFGGQGSINVNSWAGDSRHLAFVSYELKHQQ